MKKRSYKVTSSGVAATFTCFDVRGVCRREPLGEIFDRINNIHRHVEHEVFYILDGEMELVFENDSLRLSDSIAIVPAEMGHYTLADSQKLFVLYISAENEEAEMLFRERLSHVFTDAVLEEERFYIDCISKAGGEEDRYHLLSLLFSTLLRRISPDEVQAEDGGVEGGRYGFDIDEYIEMRYSESIQLADLATHLHLCEKQVSRVIKKEYHCSFPELVNRKRLSVASMMLKYTDLTVSEIAKKVGFQNDNYFYRVFGERYGETPGAYRMKQRS